MSIAIHKHKDGSTIGAIDLDKVEAVTVTKGKTLTYIFHSEKIEVDCNDDAQAELAIQAFIHRNG